MTLKKKPIYSLSKETIKALKSKAEAKWGKDNLFDEIRLYDTLDDPDSRDVLPERRYLFVFIIAIGRRPDLFCGDGNSWANKTFDSQAFLDQELSSFGLQYQSFCCGVDNPRQANELIKEDLRSRYFDQGIDLENKSAYMEILFSRHLSASALTPIMYDELKSKDSALMRSECARIIQIRLREEYYINVEESHISNIISEKFQTSRNVPSLI